MRIRENKLFSKESDIYFASCDQIDYLLSYFDLVKSYNPDAYNSVIGGMAGLNFLHLMEPKRINFIDINEHSIPFAMTIIDLIKKSNSRREFLSRVYSRPISKNISLENQWEFLTTKAQRRIYSKTRQMLEIPLKKVFDRHFFNIYKGRYQNGNFYLNKEYTNCNILTPCFPKDRNVPVFQETPVRVNSFFYGEGWLASRKSFLKTKAVLHEVKIEYHIKDIVGPNFKPSILPNEKVLYYISNVDDWVGKESFNNFQYKLKKYAKNNKISYVSVFNGVKKII